jgi:hypothetical protein
MFDAPRDTPAFEREHGFTEAEWLRMLPMATAPHPIRLLPCAADVAIGPGPGALRVEWTVLPPRQIALVRMPRLRVHYWFDGLTPAAQQAFMRQFDLHIQKGGG